MGWPRQAARRTKPAPTQQRLPFEAYAHHRTVPTEVVVAIPASYGTTRLPIPWPSYGARSLAQTGSSVCSRLVCAGAICTSTGVIVSTTVGQAAEPPKPTRQLRVERFGWTFCPGEKVMQVTNDYDREVYNGDLGVISGLDMEESELTVRFEDRLVFRPGFGGTGDG